VTEFLIPVLTGRIEIAALPLDNLSGDERTGRLADGITKDVIITPLVLYQPRKVLTGATLRLRPQPPFVPNDVATSQNFPGLVLPNRC
jgi:TolB-like protein